MMIRIDQDKLQKLAHRYQLRLLVYYGSFARKKDYDPSKSDIDIAFVSKNPLDRQQLFDLMTDLIVLHSKSAIDLVNLLTAPSLLKEAIASDGRLLYEGEEGYFQKLSLPLQKLL